MTTEKKYRELGEDELLIEGDQYLSKGQWWHTWCLGWTVKDARWPHKTKYRRPVTPDAVAGNGGGE